MGRPAHHYFYSSRQAIRFCSNRQRLREQRESYGVEPPQNNDSGRRQRRDSGAHQRQNGQKENPRTIPKILPGKMPHGVGLPGRIHVRPPGHGGTAYLLGHHHHLHRRPLRLRLREHCRGRGRIWRRGGRGPHGGQALLHCPAALARPLCGPPGVLP